MAKSSGSDQRYSHGCTKPLRAGDDDRPWRGVLLPERLSYWVRLDPAHLPQRLRPANSQHRAVYVLEVDAPFRDWQCVLRRGHSRTHVGVRLVRVEPLVDVGRKHGVFLYVHVPVIPPERPHGVRRFTGAAIRRREGCRRRALHQTRDPGAPLPLVIADAPVGQVDEETESRITDDELATGMLPTFVVQDLRREKTNSEHASCLKSA